MEFKSAYNIQEEHFKLLRREKPNQIVQKNTLFKCQLVGDLRRVNSAVKICRESHPCRHPDYSVPSNPFYSLSGCGSVPGTTDIIDVRGPCQQ